MFTIPLDTAGTVLVLAPRWADLGAGWQITLLALLLIVPAGLIVLLYRHELRLVPRGQAMGLLALRGAMVLILWLVIGVQPHLASSRVEEAPSRVRVAVDLSASMDVSDGPEARKAVVARILSAGGLNLLERLAFRHEIEIVGFDRQALELTPAQLFKKLAAANTDAAAMATDLRQPLQKASSAPLQGIVLFSDGQHNAGTPPYDLAEELGRRKTPVYPVAIGSKEPPSDLAIVDVQAPKKVFKDATATIDVRCRVTKLPAQDITVEMQIDGQPALQEHRKVIRHGARDETIAVQFQAKMEKVGTHALTIKATTKGGKEITLANNQTERIVRVGDQKARILLIDGEARWEYHYLANALTRDPALHVDRVLFAQPRIGLIKEDQLEKLDNPKTKLPEMPVDPKGLDPLLEYDCIIVGDVSPEQLPIADRRRLEKYVAERGGTLVMIAGKRYLPLAYMSQERDDDPVRKLLPITEPRVLEKEAGFTLHVTSEGKLRPFLNLEPERPGFAWPELPKHYWGIVGKRKPAASVLLVPQFGAAPPSSKEEGETALLVEQNFGFGRVVFMGLDSTWRWRYRAGDTYHHRFWGQLVRWAAADRLLPAGNRLVRYGPREPAYVEGDDVDLAVRLHESLPPLKDASQARVKLFRRDDKGNDREIAVVPLSANARQRNNLEAKVRDLPAGTYRMELDIPAYREALAQSDDPTGVPARGGDVFRILQREQGELLDLSTNFALLQTLANQSDGKLYTPENVEEILDRLDRRIERKEIHAETRPWRDEPAVWWLLGALLGLLTLEWGWRRWLDLP